MGSFKSRCHLVNILTRAIEKSTVTKIAEDLGCEVTSLSTPQELQALMTADTPDIIVLAPEDDGDILQTVIEIHKNLIESHLVVLLITPRRSDIPPYMKHFRQGNVGYITRPWGEEECKRYLRRILESL